MKYQLARKEIGPGKLIDIRLAKNEISSWLRMKYQAG
jgi:hypothetical protein